MSHLHSDTQLLLIHDFYRAFESNNEEVLKRVCRNDWKDIPLGPGQKEGPDGLLPIMSHFQKCIQNMKFEVKETISVPGRVAARVVVTGTHVGSLFGEEVSHKNIELSIHEFHHIENNKVTHTWHMEDWLGFFNQVSSFPK